jgi:hypothetical protein
MVHRKKPQTLRETVAEMSIAGEPENVQKAANAISESIKTNIDLDNIPSVDNMIFAMEFLIWELKQWRRKIYNRQHPKIKH